MNLEEVHRKPKESENAHQSKRSPNVHLSTHFFSIFNDGPSRLGELSNDLLETSW
jgi:hypothetical protein